VHIPSSSRLAVSTQSKRGGRPRRPQKSVASVVSNLHLLLHVPSFARWPLRVHFFERAVYAAWGKWCATVSEPVRDSLGVVVDFGGGGEEAVVVAKEREGPGLEPGPEPEPCGIHALPLDYEPIQEYVAKGQEIFEFERQGNCVVCHEEMSTGEGLHALCSNEGCDGVGHLACWGRRLLRNSDGDKDGADIVPVQGQCPKCHGRVLWGDMMRELTLRTRGAKDVEKLLNRKRQRVTKKVAKG
jgi:structure-specific endonuclease subunit SLX1